MNKKFARFAHIASSPEKAHSHKTEIIENSSPEHNNSDKLDQIRQRASIHAKSIGLNNVPFWLTEIIAEISQNQQVSRTFINNNRF
ncbi:hypothetical protein [Photobacterium kishitanii]|uniref:Uncharacterized protein n=1 Tax=Photobacterium kishitanii TaxID=318456 RepID=A0A2T3KLW7_9GAMM|nr:hypothetical protein [Photobacterium kishitanii]PSV00673.1 hypothetical protein C9J27_05910 [Photobacterium kishitanii]